MKFVIWNLYFFYLFFISNLVISIKVANKNKKMAFLISNEISNLLGEIPKEFENSSEYNIYTINDKTSSEFIYNQDDKKGQNGKINSNKINKKEGKNNNSLLNFENFGKQFRDFKINLDLAETVKADTKSHNDFRIPQDKYLFPNKDITSVNSKKDEGKRSDNNKTIIKSEQFYIDKNITNDTIRKKDKNINFTDKNFNLELDFEKNNKTNLNSVFDNIDHKQEKVVYLNNTKLIDSIISSHISFPKSDKYQGFLSLFNRAATDSDDIELYDLKPRETYKVASIYDKIRQENDEKILSLENAKRSLNNHDEYLKKTKLDLNNDIPLKNQGKNISNIDQLKKNENNKNMNNTNIYKEKIIVNITNDNKESKIINKNAINKDLFSKNISNLNKTISIINKNQANLIKSIFENLDLNISATNKTFNSSNKNFAMKNLENLSLQDKTKKSLKEETKITKNNILDLMKIKSDNENRITDLLKTFKKEKDEALNLKFNSNKAERITALLKTLQSEKDENKKLSIKLKTYDQQEKMLTSNLPKIKTKSEERKNEEYNSNKITELLKNENIRSLIDKIVEIKIENMKKVNFECMNACAHVKFEKNMVYDFENLLKSQVEKKIIYNKNNKIEENDKTKLKYFNQNNNKEVNFIKKDSYLKLDGSKIANDEKILKVYNLDNDSNNNIHKSDIIANSNKNLINKPFDASANTESNMNNLALEKKKQSKKEIDKSANQIIKEINNIQESEKEPNKYAKRIIKNVHNVKQRVDHENEKLKENFRGNRILNINKNNKTQIEQTEKEKLNEMEIFINKLKSERIQATEILYKLSNTNKYLYSVNSQINQEFNEMKAENEKLVKSTNNLKNYIRKLKDLASNCNMKFRENKNILKNKFDELSDLSQKLIKCEKDNKNYRNIVDSNLIKYRFVESGLNDNYDFFNSFNKQNKLSGYSFRSINDDIRMDKNDDLTHNIMKKKIPNFNEIESIQNRGIEDLDKKYNTNFLLEKYNGFNEQAIKSYDKNQIYNISENKVNANSQNILINTNKNFQRIQDKSILNLNKKQDEFEIRNYLSKDIKAKANYLNDNLETYYQDENNDFVSNILNKIPTNFLEVDYDLNHSRTNKDPLYIFEDNRKSETVNLENSFKINSKQNLEEMKGLIMDQKLIDQYLSNLNEENINNTFKEKDFTKEKSENL